MKNQILQLIREYIAFLMANGWQINQATAATQNQQNQANQGQNVAWFGEPPAAIRQAIGRYAPDVLAQYSAPNFLEQTAANEMDPHKQPEQTFTPWSNQASLTSRDLQTTPSPWRNNQTLTPWNGGYDLGSYKQSGENNKPIDYSLYGDDFSHEFIDKMENDEEFQKILNEYIIPNEGGYSNDPDDSGGETNMGIAKNAHPNENIANMTRERANAIYYKDYYNWNGLNKLPYPIRGFVVDYGLPTKPQFALETVHKVLNLPPNGTIIGPTTLGIFENYTEKDYNDFLEKYRAEMKKHFNEVAQRNPQKRKYLNGWLNRADGAHLAK